MNLTSKLLGFLNRVFDKDPKPYVALRVGHEAAFSWKIEARLLTLTPSSGPALTYDLNASTVGDIFQALSVIDGFEVTVGDASRTGLSASVLLDGEGVSTGEAIALQGYSSLLWSYLEAVADQLSEMRQQVGNMLLQLSTTTGEGIWLDEVGSYYGVPRFPGETDSAYAPRIIAETLRPRSNNVALAAAIETYTGQVADVIDVTLYGSAFPRRNGAIDRDGAYNHDSGAELLYGLFDISYAYDLLNGADIGDFQDQLRSVISRLRAAGTHLRALALRGSEIGDEASVGTDSLVTAAQFIATDSVDLPADEISSFVGTVALTDSVSTPTETSNLSYPVHLIRDGEHTRGEGLIHCEYAIVSQTLEGTDVTVVPA